MPCKAYPVTQRCRFSFYSGIALKKSVALSNYYKFDVLPTHDQFEGIEQSSKILVWLYIAYVNYIRTFIWRIFLFRQGIFMVLFTFGFVIPVLGWLFFTRDKWGLLRPKNLKREYFHAEDSRSRSHATKLAPGGD
jgi:hypothetical protein